MMLRNHCEGIKSLFSDARLLFTNTDSTMYTEMLDLPALGVAGRVGQGAGRRRPRPSTSARAGEQQGRLKPAEQGQHFFHHKDRQIGKRRPHAEDLQERRPGLLLPADGPRRHFRGSMELGLLWRRPSPASAARFGAGRGWTCRRRGELFAVHQPSAGPGLTGASKRGSAGPTSFGEASVAFSGALETFRCQRRGAVTAVHQPSAGPPRPDRGLSTWVGRANEFWRS